MYLKATEVHINEMDSDNNENLTVVDNEEQPEETASEDDEQQDTNSGDDEQEECQTAPDVRCSLIDKV